MKSLATITALVLSATSLAQTGTTFKLGWLDVENNFTYNQVGNFLVGNQTTVNTLSMNYLKLKWGYKNQWGMEDFNTKSFRHTLIDFKGFALMDFASHDGVESQSFGYTNKNVALSWKKSHLPSAFDEQSQAVVAGMPRNTDTEQLSMMLTDGKSRFNFENIKYGQVVGSDQSEVTRVVLNHNRLNLYSTSVDARLGEYSAYGGSLVDKKFNIAYNHYAATDDFVPSAYTAGLTPWGAYLKGRSQDEIVFNYGDKNTQLNTLYTTIGNEDLLKLSAQQKLGKSTSVDVKYAEYEKDDVVVNYSSVKVDTKLDKSDHSVSESKSKDQTIIATNNNFDLGKNIKVKTNVINVTRKEDEKAFIGVGLGFKQGNINIDLMQQNDYLNADLSWKYGSGDLKFDHYQNRNTKPTYTNSYNGISSNPYTFGLFNNYLESYDLISYSFGNQVGWNQKLGSGTLGVNGYRFYDPYSRVEKLDFAYKVKEWNLFFNEEDRNGLHMESYGFNYNYNLKGKAFQLNLMKKSGALTPGWYGGFNMNFAF